MLIEPYNMLYFILYTIYCVFNDQLIYSKIMKLGDTNIFYIFYNLRNHYYYNIFTINNIYSIYLLIVKLLY
jgi:hypothetical protein